MTLKKKFNNSGVVEGRFRRWNATCSIADASLTNAEARIAIFEFIEGWYKTRRGVVQCITSARLPGSRTR